MGFNKKYITKDLIISTIKSNGSLNELFNKNVDPEIITLLLQNSSIDVNKENKKIKIIKVKEAIKCGGPDKTFNGNASTMLVLGNLKKLFVKLKIHPPNPEAKTKKIKQDYNKNNFCNIAFLIRKDKEEEFKKIAKKESGSITNYIKNALNSTYKLDL